MSVFESLKKAFQSKASAESPAAASKAPAREASGGSAKKAAHPSSERRLLFVGGNAAWFKLIEESIRGLEPGWACQYVKDSDGARMAMASAVPFNVLLIDGRVRDGSKLLEQMEQRRGEIVCLMRCSTPDRPALDQWNCSPATMISEDCDAAMLVATVKKNERLRAWMSDGPMKRLLRQIQKLPVAPEIYMQVTEHLESPNGSMVTVARLISQDPVMSAKILQVVNSVYFGLAHEVTDTAEAVMVLGAERVKSLILLAGIFSQYRGEQTPGFSPEPVWEHSLQVAMFARAIAFGETQNGGIAEAAFTAGLLHDVGKLILAVNFSEMCAAVRELQAAEKISQPAAELKVLGTTHAEFAACLLGTWGLPLPVLEAIAWHHAPQRSSETGFTLLAAVCMANIFARENAAGLAGEGVPEPASREFLESSGLGGCEDRWRGFCGLSASEHS